VAYLAGINFLDLTPKGSLLSQRLFAELHPASPPCHIFLVKYGRQVGLSSRGAEAGASAPADRMGYKTRPDVVLRVNLLTDLGQICQGLFDHLIRVEFDILQFSFQEGVVGRQVEVAVAR
jgi:hypothetical protein